MKPTRIVSNYCLKSLVRPCDGMHVHQRLQGFDVHGEHLTVQACGYPPRLCRQWAEDILRAATPGPPGLEPPVFPSPVAPVVSSIPPVRDVFCDIKNYRILVAKPWHKPEAIHMLEARAVFKAVQHCARTPACRGCRVLILCDNMAVVLAINKGRATHPGLLTISRRVAAYCLAWNITLRLRYVETERNAADGPTRPSKAIPQV